MRELDKLEKQVAELEQAQETTAADAANSPTRWTGKLRTFLEWVLQPAAIREWDANDRREMWAWWQMLRILKSPELERFTGWWIPAYCERVLKAAKQWFREWFDSPTGHSPASWNPINPVSLAEFKDCVQYASWTDPQYIPEFGDEIDGIRRAKPRNFTGALAGIQHAKQLSHYFGTAGPLTPDFNPNSDDWPSSVVTIVKDTLSWPPDEVPPFDWRDVNDIKADEPAYRVIPSEARR